MTGNNTQRLLLVVAASLLGAVGASLLLPLMPPLRNDVVVFFIGFAVLLLSVISYGVVYPQEFDAFSEEQTKNHSRLTFTVATATAGSVGLFGGGLHYQIIAAGIAGALCAHVFLPLVWYSRNRVRLVTLRVILGSFLSVVALIFLRPSLSNLSGFAMAIVAAYLVYAIYAHGLPRLGLPNPYESDGRLWIQLLSCGVMSVGYLYTLGSDFAVLAGIPVVFYTVVIEVLGTLIYSNKPAGTVAMRPAMATR